MRERGREGEGEGEGETLLEGKGCSGGDGKVEKRGRARCLGEKGGRGGKHSQRCRRSRPRTPPPPRPRLRAATHAHGRTGAPWFVTTDGAAPVIMFHTPGGGWVKLLGFDWSGEGRDRVWMYVCVCVRVRARVCT